MQVTVGNQLRIENPSEQLLTWCKKQLILPNPEYAKKVRMHFWVGNTPEKLYLFQWDGDTLVLPYADKQEVVLTPNQQLGDQVPAEDLEKKYLEDVVGASSDYDSED